MTEPTLPGRPQSTTRDVAKLCDGFPIWLQPQIGSDEAPRMTLLGAPARSGFSSETVLFDLEWRRAGRPCSGRYVMRLPPAPDAFPLFPTYDLERQLTAMRLAGARDGVPVPAVCWEELSGDVLGAPFFVMERVDGEPAPDVPPYVFDSWLTEATPPQLAGLERDIVQVLACIHRPRASMEELASLELACDGAGQLERHFVSQRQYYEWIRATHDVPLIDAAFAALESRLPAAGDTPTLTWGDARIANLLFRDSRVVAVLDWEAAAPGPGELDLGWFVYFRDYFQRLAERYGRRGLPDFLTRDFVVATYAELTGRPPRDLDWYIDYAALRQALVSVRVCSRAIAFGEREPVSDPNDLILDRVYLEGLLSA